MRRMIYKRRRRRNGGRVWALDKPKGRTSTKVHIEVLGLSTKSPNNFLGQFSNSIYSDYFISLSNLTSTFQCSKGYLDTILSECERTSHNTSCLHLMCYISPTCIYIIIVISREISANMAIFATLGGGGHLWF